MDTTKSDQEMNNLHKKISLGAPSNLCMKCTGVQGLDHGHVFFLFSIPCVEPLLSYVGVVYLVKTFQIHIDNPKVKDELFFPTEGSRFCVFVVLWAFYNDKKKNGDFLTRADSEFSKF